MMKTDVWSSGTSTFHSHCRLQISDFPMKPVPFSHFGLEQALMKLHFAQGQLEQPQKPLGVLCGVTTKSQPLT